MKKIGIATFCRANNYGAVLQAYGLSQYLKKDNEVEFLDLRFNPAVENVQKKDKYSLYQKIFGKIRAFKFEQFRNENLKISNEVIYGDKDSEKLQDKYDYYVVGSDQVWNTDITNNTRAFFLDFVKEKTKIAYAASFGKSNLNETERKLSEENLKNYKGLSVREKQSAIYLKQELNINAQVVCDPVFLISKNEWIKKCNLKNKKKSYILIYYMECNSILELVIEKIKKEYNFPIIAIQGGMQKLKGIKHLDGIGPKDFLNIVYNAKFVITNSFHALAFSIIFNKKVIVFEHSKWNLRLSNLLELTENNDKILRLTDKIDDKTINEKIINGNIAYSKLTPLIKDSKQFLIDSIG